MVDNLTFRKKFLNQKGQAIFELVLFLPILLFLYTIYNTAGDSISGSINQQKAVRGYFYSLVKGNSYLVTPQELREFAEKGVKRVGFNSVGWRNKKDGGQSSFAPCFGFSSILKNSTTEECDSDERETENSSRFIRLFTFYGACGPTYTVDPRDSAFTINPGDQGAIGGGMKGTAASCVLGSN